MTNNTTKDQILALFEDNVTNSISAADMRTYVNAIFEKEEKIVKMALDTDLASLNTNIYEGSLVVVWSGENKGLYISTVNQPTLLTELIKI